MYILTIPVERIADLLLLVLRSRGYIFKHEIQDYLQLGIYTSQQIFNALQRIEGLRCNNHICIDPAKAVDLGERRFNKRTASIPFKTIEEGEYLCVIDMSMVVPCRVYGNKKKDRKAKSVKIYLRTGEETTGRHHVIVIARPPPR